MTPAELDHIDATAPVEQWSQETADRLIAALREAWAEAARLRAALALQAESVENAGAAIARVRALCDEAERWALSSPSVSTSRIRAALDLLGGK